MRNHPDLPPPKPLKYTPPLEGERLRLYVSMPLLDGHVISLNFVPRGKLGTYEKLWGEWLRNHDRRDWPEWAEKWVDDKKKLAKAV